MKPSTPKGTRDFLPQVVQRRNYIFNTIKEVFEKYGFAPIETPAMENLETLTGKYGEEGDRLIFKVLARGEKLKKALDSGNEKSIAEEALRYDLTVPFARFVVQHQNDLSFPFRRYQIQPVWRADRPQKGRYREFFQCDADVIGTDSLCCEVEFVQIFDEVFDKLNLPVQIRINNRKILSALAVYIGQENHFTELTIAIDKLDKLPLNKVLQDLSDKGFAPDSIELLNEVLQITEKADSNEAILKDLEERFADIPDGTEGIEEMRYVMRKAEALGLAKAELKLDINLARGLNYYTGAIFEVLPLTEHQVGSICGGGRYDDLTGIFGLKDMSGVGISFGADRIYDLLETMDLFPDSELQNTELMFVNFGEKEADFCHSVLSILRKEGLRGELYPDAAKMKKQMKYANEKNIPFVAIVGENEMEQQAVTLKNMRTGDQDLVPLKEILSNLRNL